LQKIDTKKFQGFLEQWNNIQGFSTPFIHLKMADWLQNCYETGETRLLLMAFRACGKSTMIGLFSAWLLRERVGFRILVLAAEHSLATKMVRNIRKIIERHPQTQNLLPSKKDQWASDRFTVHRSQELRDPSVLAAGITGNITGSRADFIIYDDVEVPNTSNTSNKREALRERLQESNFILSPGWTQLYVGTPHSYFSIYAAKVRKETNEKEIFLADYKRYEQPLLNDKKQSVWPELFPQETVDTIKKQSGPNKFVAQMMLKPINVTISRLNAELLQYYKTDITYLEAQQRIYLSLDKEKLVSCSAWWDPAFGHGANGDSSVLAIVFTDEKGQYYLHHLSYIRVNPQKGEDEATLQCRNVGYLAGKFFLPSVNVETNGIGKFLPAILKREIADLNIPCAVIDCVTKKPKSERILEAFDAVMAAQALYVHDSVKDTPFLLEMADGQPRKKNMKDDGLDAVAGALLSEPVRIQRSVITTKRKWLNGSHSFSAHTDFTV